MTIKTTMRLVLAVGLLVGSVSGQEEYGADISFPMHYHDVTINYPWLPWNVDPSVEVPEEYKGMPVQPLGDKRGFYENYLKGCVEYYGDRGDRCIENENDRVAMSLRQPQSMVVSVF